MKLTRNILQPTIFIFAIAFFIGCKDYKPEMEQALYERDSIMMMSEAKDSSINTFLSTLNEIELNLDSITQSQQAIALDSKEKVEFNKDIRERINLNIAIINELLEKNRLLINSLNEKVRKSNINLGALRATIEKLNADVIKKDEELALLNGDITQLRSMIDNMSASIDSLHFENRQKADVISSKIVELQTAYWIIGTYKQLKDKGILDKKGGFIGMGREKVLKKDFNNESFNQIDITKTTTFDINSKTAKIISNHPSSSYKLEKDAKGAVTQLVVTDPARFWRASKYLVIVTG